MIGRDVGARVAAGGDGGPPFAGGSWAASAPMTHTTTIDSTVSLTAVANMVCIAPFVKLRIGTFGQSPFA
ncbi:MAG: hypothetical protein ABSH20_15815 [Tepidisphaeraceae bacterium]